MKLVDPKTVSIRSGPPTMALAGEIEMFASGVPGGTDLGEDCLRGPPPQASWHTIRNPTTIHEKRLSITSSNPGDIGQHGSIACCWERLVCPLMRETGPKTAILENCIGAFDSVRPLPL